MIIKKYTGKTEAEATEAAKKELGSGLVIMNVREVKKKGFFAFLSPKQIEITAALEEEKPQKPQYGSITRTTDAPAENRNLFVRNSTENIEKKLDSLQTLLESQLNSRQATGEETGTHRETVSEEKEKKDSEAETPEKKEEEQNPEQDKFIRLLYNKMLDNEMDEKYVNSILEDASKTKKADLPFDYLLANIYQKMVLKFGKSEGITPSADGPRIVLFIGPTGVGKTTTIAKLAGKYCVEDKKKVALLTADTYRIAATEQLRTYAEILDVPFQVIYSGEELLQAQETYKDFDFILVDTAGHSPANEEQHADLKHFVNSVNDKVIRELYLVMSATTKYKDLLRIVDSYEDMKGFRLIFTKLDETSECGNILNVRMYTKAKLSYVTYGQNVPEDIQVFDAQSTVKKLLGGN